MTVIFFKLKYIEQITGSMVTAIDKYVIQAVKRKRTEKKFSQSKLAFELDVPTSFIAMIESGKYDKKYNIAHLNALARILECSPRDFLPDETLDD